MFVEVPNRPKQLPTSTVKVVESPQFYETACGWIWKWEDIYWSITGYIPFRAKSRDSGDVRFTYLQAGKENDNSDFKGDSKRGKYFIQVQCQ